MGVQLLLEAVAAPVQKPLLPDGDHNICGGSNVCDHNNHDGNNARDSGGDNSPCVCHGSSHVRLL
jgi:hypothetical protein